ncbi:MAG: type IX secretion system outer membrane channel protein PorV [Mariniphaga sp.]|jgi:hypothetical protein|nr:type IX secretion system outer membrane channel protein PorV [Mariniphaga sp.]
MIKLVRFIFVSGLIVLFAINAFGQGSITGSNTITTAVPFLSITPDSRAGGIGDAGVGTTPDLSSQHWNPAKYPFMESDMGVSLSYSPWLRNLIDDMNLAYLVGYKKIDDIQTVSSSLRYFDLGQLTTTDEYGVEGVQIIPNEFAIDIGYSRLLSEVISGSVAIRYIRSDISGGQMVGGVESRPGNTYAADVAFYYFNEFRANRRDNIFSAGINIQNIGGKISYTEDAVSYFIPTTLKLGAAYTMEVDQYNKFSFSFEANKLLVPTPPRDTTTYQEGEVITDFFSSDKSTVAGIFSSFGDAPGGFQEELQEINLSAGIEYWYNNQFALRAGYFHEHANKGNRKFLTFGAGFKMNVFALDFSYLLPTQQNHPLSNTLRFTLAFDVEAFSNQR